MLSSFVFLSLLIDAPTAADLIPVDILIDIKVLTKQFKVQSIAT